MHVGRDEKIPIALLYTNERIIVSPAYWVFEVSNTTQLLPDYLMLWFRRNEFDRNAWFYTDSDVRGGMSKEALMDMTLPIPPIEQQQKIVAEYEAAFTLMNKSLPSWKKRHKPFIARCLWMGLIRRICRKGGEWELWKCFAN